MNSFCLIWLKELNSFLKWLKELNSSFLIWLKELNSFVEYDSTKWTLFLLTQRIEIFSMWYKEFFHKHDSQHLTLWKNMTQELNFFLKSYDSQNWTLPINTTHRMEPFFSIWLKELNIFFQKNFFNMTQKMKIFNMFWRVEPFFDMT